MGDSTILYSVIVCSFNGSRTIGECLQAILHQTTPLDSYEIIVVDDGSTDGLSQIVTTLFSSRTHCHLIRFEHNRGLSAARNAGWRAACGAIVLYIDDDAVPDPDWIEQLA